MSIYIKNKEEFEKLRKELRERNLKTSKEKGKTFGECEVCGTETVLVEVTGMCGPCTFGEADTINGNW